MDHNPSGDSAGNPLMSAHSTDIKPITPGLQAWSQDALAQSPQPADTPQPMAPSQPNRPFAGPTVDAASIYPPRPAEPFVAATAAPSAAPSGFIGGSFAAKPEPPQPRMPESRFSDGELLPAAPSGFSMNDQPMPVVKVLSVRGVEYLMMMFNLWIADAALLWIVLALFNGQVGFSILAFPIAVMLVTGPIFAYLFLRLKKAELLDPSLRFDPSKRRTTQLTQLFTFLVCIANVIGFIYVVLNKMGGGGGMSIGKAFLNMLAVLIVIGGVFAYYWIDEHRVRS